MPHPHLAVATIEVSAVLPTAPRTSGWRTVFTLRGRATFTAVMSALAPASRHVAAFWWYFRPMPLSGDPHGPGAEVARGEGHRLVHLLDLQQPRVEVRVEATRPLQLTLPSVGWPGFQSPPYDR
ncbi:hypothetical protein [Streptomyces sp. NPDC017988]|uniref:hypothetical protein n=1 Tax=Streptomyces sp. NPDC017988 TaxID=3365025 RepID=UPI0037AF5A70